MNILIMLRDKNNAALQFVYFVGIVFLGAIYYLRNKGYSVDDSFITYRYAFHLKEGIGLTFNAGENYYGTTAAGYAVLLAAISSVLDRIIGGPSLGIQSVSVALSALSIGIIAAYLPRLLRAEKNALRLFVCAVFAGYLFAGFPFNEVAGHETYSFIATAFVASVFACYGRSLLAGCILAIAATFRPDAVLFAPILVLLDWGRSKFAWKEYFTSKSFWRFFLGFTAIIVPWLIYLWIHFGQPTPGTMDAKKAQVVLGYWPLYNPANLFKYIADTLDTGPLFVLCIGLIASVRMVVRTGVQSALQNDRGFFIASSWLLFGLGSACAYFLFNVTFWRWYGVPVLFSLGVASLFGWRYVIDQFDSASESLTQDLGLAKFIRTAPFVVIGLLAIGATSKLVTWYRSENINAHIHAYSEIVDYLKREEPNGTVIQMFEPGSFGYGLGPKFSIVDELGLISPNVAKALLKGDNGYAMRTYMPKYLVCSWRGSYSECSSANLADRFELIGEFNANFWGPQIGSGAKLYRRLDTLNANHEAGITVSATTLGDRWGKAERIGATSEWFVHPGATTNTILKITCKNGCSGNYWAHIANLPTEAPSDAGNVAVKITDSKGRTLFENVVTRQSPMNRVALRTDSTALTVLVNNNGKPDYDWLVFGAEVPGK